MNKYIIAFGLFSYWFSSAAAYAQSVCPPDQELHFGVCMQVIGDSTDLDNITNDDIPVLDGVNDSAYAPETLVVEEDTTPVIAPATAHNTMHRTIRPSFRDTKRPNIARSKEEQIAVNHSTDDELVNLKQSDMLNYRLALREQYRNTMPQEPVEVIEMTYEPMDDIVIDTRTDDIDTDTEAKKAHMTHLSYHRLSETGASYPLFIALIMLMIGSYNLYVRTKNSL